jgi:Ca-activated chloride channel family protein
MIRGMHYAALVAALVAAGSRTGSAQEASATQGSGLTITTPAENAYITGSIVLQASVRPTADVRQMTFFADGRSVCVVVQPPFDCAWDAGGGLREHVIRVVATLADGRRLIATRRTRDAGYTETVDVEVVQVTATVTDSSGRFVPGLTRDKFRVREDGAAQRLSAFAGEDTPLEVVVAVDVSASMADAMPVLKAAVRAFLAALRPSDKVTLIAFNDNIFTLARRSTDPAARVKAVDRLAPWGGTALYDAILTSLATVGKQPGRRALVVFTDGEDQNSVATMKRVELRLETSDATIYTIGLGRSVRNRDLAGVLEHMSEVSGGRAFIVDQATALQQVFAEIIDELSHQYLLSYASSNDKRDGSWRTIQVELTDRQYKVRHRQGYRAPGTRKK